MKSYGTKEMLFLICQVEELLQATKTLYGAILEKRKESIILIMSIQKMVIFLVMD